jgi:hypothetical protein
MDRGRCPDPEGAPAPLLLGWAIGVMPRWPQPVYVTFGRRWWT